MPISKPFTTPSAPILPSAGVRLQVLKLNLPLLPPDYRLPYLCVFIQLFPPVLCPFFGEGLSHGYLLYPYRAGSAVPVHDPRSVRQQHCSLQDCKSQTVSLVLDTIRLAVKKEKVAGELHLHSDQGFQYTSQAYFNLTKEYGIMPSMSRRGNCYDNAMAENFFGILKTECICRQKLKTFQQANDLIDEYIHFYNSERIQTKTGLAK